MLLGTLIATSASAQVAGAVPNKKVCDDKKNPPKDAVTQGGCVVLDRKKGNCMACHAIAGTTHGNIAPPLVQMKQRFPDKAKLRTQIGDAHKLNPRSVMPPFGPHEILTQDEIDKVVEFVLTL
ncbi:MAG: sulfur oxidation c-type cytochrome SoxX [Candidatus Muproteobacteria bacterium RBG_16_62_13]|uniref:Sulfur oxidation c-type cytochrome SoxX n=1 Tax=Candidatus Muproteobacteria bacterium RBG_16_62_13 TaxID=1817756 RepID=A0A1F6T8A7_9PROT|nr:MAG: sulfur oxidation c-type cytochrome SoxX [Candidatus Muproteobacteria bacterium RBG_16_62_13]